MTLAERTRPRHCGALTPQQRVDERVRATVALHFDPSDGAAYWLDRQRSLGIDVRRDVVAMPDGSHAHDGPSYPPREFWDRRPVSIDIYNNYITNAHDNSIEMDGSMHNIRVMRNVLINSASHPMSTQPSVGGPIYWIRNIVYHAPGGSTRSSAGSPGVIFYHNTVTSETSIGTGANRHWRNNLILGQGTAPAIFSVTTSTAYSSSDYNGFRPNPGAPYSFQWNVAPEAVAGGRVVAGACAAHLHAAEVGLAFDEHDHLFVELEEARVVRRTARGVPRLDLAARVPARPRRRIRE